MLSFSVIGSVVYAGLAKWLSPAQHEKSRNDVYAVSFFLHFILFDRFKSYSYICTKYELPRIHGFFFYLAWEV